MEIRISKNALKPAIASVSKAVPGKAALPILAFMRVQITEGEMKLTGYSLETGVIATIPCETGIDAQYVDFCVDNRKFTEIVAKAPADEITIDIDISSLQMIIKSGRSKCKIAVMSAENYPEIPDVTSADSITIPGDKLADMIRQTIFAVAVSENKPVLTGELFTIKNNTITVSACDGYRFAQRKEPIDTDIEAKFVIKGFALKNVMSMTDDNKNVTLYISKKHVLFDFGDKTLVTRLLEGDYPDTSKSFPASAATEVTINTRPLLECLDRFMLLIDDRNKAPAKFVFADRKIEIELKNGNGEMNETNEECDIFGNDVTIAFNCKYLFEAIKASESDKVKLIMNGGLTPMLIKPVDGDAYSFLVLPVRIKN